MRQKLKTREAPEDRIFNAAASIGKSRRSIQRSTQSVIKRAKLCSKVGGGIFENNG